MNYHRLFPIYTRYLLPSLALLALLLFAACQAPPQSPVVKVVEVMVSATPAPTTAVTTIYVTATPQPAPARLLSRQPAAVALNQRQPTIQLTFNQEMDAASLSAALQLEPALPFTVEVDGSLVFVHFDAPLAFETSYYLTLPQTAVSAAGAPLNKAYTWHYRLRPPVGNVNGPSAARPDAPITIRFNYAIQEASLSQALQIEPAINGKIAWSDDYKILTLIPDTALTGDTTYSLSFASPLRDRDGREISLPETFHFTTPPPILSRSPQGNNINPNTRIEVRFDRPMDTAATEAAFQIEPAVSGAFSWQETTLRFQPDGGYLAANTAYAITILPTALDADGEQILNEANRWTFTTGHERNVAGFGYGPNAQVLDANGRRAVQFETFTDAGVTVSFDLYRLSLTQFLDRYSANFKSSWWEESGDEVISTAGATLAHSWTMQTTDSATQWVNAQEVLIPADVPPGLYILNLAAGRLNDQLILVLTANTLAVKQAEGQIVAWVTDINGTPAAGIEVAVYARDGSRLAGGVADESGIFRTELSAFADGGPAAIEPLIVVAQHNNDITVSGLSQEWQSSYGQREWWRPTPQNPNSAAFITTDRPIYKPGHDVYFKAVVRQDDDAVLSLPPAGTAVTVRMRDGRNNVVQTFALTTNDFGTVNGLFHLAEGAMLGHYHVEVELDGTRHRQLFKVEDYRKPDYEVTLRTDASQYLLGDTIEVTIDTAYYFGEPVPDAEIIIRRFVQEQNWYGAGHWYEAYGTANQPITGRTDAHGRFTTTIPIPANTSLGSYNDYSSWGSSLRRAVWGLEATVDDGSHQTVSDFVAVTLYDALEEITMHSGGYVQAPGRPFSIHAQVQTIFGDPAPDRALTAELARWNRNSGNYSTIVQTAALNTDANGRATTPFTIAEPGYYQLRLVGADGRGQRIQYTRYLYAFSDFYSNWYGRNDGAVRVDVAAESYAPGETAQLIVETTRSGPALLTVERGSTRREQLVQLTAPVTLIDLPIMETDAPNVYVAINAWEPLTTTIDLHTHSSLPDGRLHSAYTNISVPATSKRLNVTITPDKAQYAPREEATFTVRVTNYQGEPVSAELALALVDEAIFALSSELSGPMYDAFYYERSSIVRTYNSLQPTRYLGGGGGMGGGGGDDASGGPRADFPDTAAWFPVLHTDFNGEASITLTLPDNLTTWRLTAKATTADTQVGEATANITTWQPIIARPLLPRLLTAGDTAVLSAIIHNYSEETQTISVTLTINSAQLTTPHSQLPPLTIPAGASRLVGWPVEAKETGEAVLLLTAVTQSGIPGDAIQLPLTIQPLAVPDVQTQVGQFSSRLRTTVQIPADALPMSVVEIQLSRSIAGTLLEGLEYLTGYPYGCVEQTMSKALPNAVVGRALNQLGVTNPTLQAELPGYINASVQRLYGFQHNDGGWGWWYDDATHDYQTAWVIFGLAQVAEAGYEVDTAVIERGAAWLNDNLGGMDARTRAFALYALAEAGQPNAEATLALANDPQSLQGDVFSLAGLALALHTLGENTLAREVVDGLAQTATSTTLSAGVSANGLTYWSGASHDGYYNQKTMSSDVRSTALALSAFTQIRPGHELEGGIARWLMGQRRSQGWGNTNETSFAILGLTDHLLASAFSEAAANSNYTVLLNGAVISQGALGRGAPAVTLPIPRQQLADGQNEIVVTQDGGRPLYYTINSRTYLAQTEIDAGGVINIAREYLDPQTDKPLLGINAGQLVQVRLTVQMPENGSYMIVEDKLPGGLEALNEGLNTTSKIANEYWMYGADPSTWRSLGYNYKEIFGDRVSFFITEMDKGTRTFTYLARATLPGQFTAMPAEASGMYNPALWGRSASAQLTVAAGE